MEDLINKFIENKLSKSESKQLQKWLEEDEGNARYFKNYIIHNDLSGVEVDVSRYKVWKKLNVNRDASLEVLDVEKDQRSYKSLIYKVAAILVLVLGLSLFIDSYVTTSGNEVVINTELVTKTASRGQKLTVKLPDGTLVKLNAGSSVSYPNNFQEHNRIVSLSGEAFFDVVRDERRPFQIEFNGLEVAVLGTSFNIDAYEDSDAVVSVLTGRVAVSNLSNGSKMILEKNERARVNKHLDVMNREVIDSEDMDFDWTDNYLSFDNQAMDTAFDAVSNWFDVDIQVDNEVTSNEYFRAKFKNPTLEEVMKSLAFAYGFEYKIEKDKISIMNE